MNVDESAQGEEPGGAPTRICAVCGHGEGEHEVQEVELPGRTGRSTFCISCGEFHDFVPTVED